MYFESITSKVGRQLLIAYASIRPRNSALVAASMAPMLDKPSQIAKASRPASSNVATTSPRRTPRARNRAAHCSIDESSSDQLAESPETVRSEDHTSELQSLIRLSYAVFFLKKKYNT